MAIIGDPPGLAQIAGLAERMGYTGQSIPSSKLRLFGRPNTTGAEAIRREIANTLARCGDLHDDACIAAAKGLYLLFFLSSATMQEVDAILVQGSVEDAAYDQYTILEAYLDGDPMRDDSIGTLERIRESLFRYTGLGMPSFRAPSGCQTLLDRAAEQFPGMAIVRKPGVWVLYTDPYMSEEVCNSSDFGHLLAEALETCKV